MVQRFIPLQQVKSRLLYNGLMHEHINQQLPLEPAVLQAFMALFFPRPDVHARQQADGRYRYYPEPVTADLVIAHLRGEVTLGTYTLTRDSQAWWVVIDADREADWHQIRQAAPTVEFPLYLEQSRRGGHVWVFLETPVAAQPARRFGQAVVERLGITNHDIEVFPKQDKLVGDGPGLLIRLPFGYHRKVKVPGQPGKRFYFQTLEGQPLASTISQQLALLAYAQRVPHSVFEVLVADIPVETTRPLPAPTTAFQLNEVDAAAPVSERIKQAISVPEFVSWYVVLDERGSGFCPFHEDRHRSFGVSEQGNYWSCFARCCEPPGGSIIDFWMHWRERVLGLDGSFTATIADLASMLGLER